MFKYSTSFSALTDPNFSDEDLDSCGFNHLKLIELERKRRYESSIKAKFVNLVNEIRKETIYVKRSHIKVIPVESKPWRDRACN